MEWYYVEGKKQKGPVDANGFKALVDSGTITEKTLVWNKTMKEWQAYGETSRQVQAATAVPAAASSGREKRCSECGNLFKEDELAVFQDALICASCKPIFLQKMREGVSTGNMTYAGFWIRFVAKIVDGLILTVINMLINFAVGAVLTTNVSNPEDFSAAMVPVLINGLLNWAVNIFYVVWFVGKHAATPGKMICGLKIVTPDGGRVSYLRALGRAFAEILSSIILCIGYIMAGFDSEKRALHDRICSTRVIKKR